MQVLMNTNDVNTSADINLSLINNSSQYEYQVGDSVPIVDTLTDTKVCDTPASEYLKNVKEIPAPSINNVGSSKDKKEDEPPTVNTINDTTNEQSSLLNKKLPKIIHSTVNFEKFSKLTQGIKKVEPENKSLFPKGLDENFNKLPANEQQRIKEELFDDLRQNNIRDCYLIASLGSIVAADPTKLLDIVKTDENGNIIVRLFNLEEDYVANINASPSLYKDHEGYFLTAGSKNSNSWVRVIEKAFADLRGKHEENIDFRILHNGDHRKTLKVLLGECSSIDYLKYCVEPDYLKKVYKVEYADEQLKLYAKIKEAIDNNRPVVLAIHEIPEELGVDGKRISGLWDQHDYSILGIGRSDEGRLYIKIRNNCHNDENTTTKTYYIFDNNKYIPISYNLYDQLHLDKISSFELDFNLLYSTEFSVSNLIIKGGNYSYLHNPKNNVIEKIKYRDLPEMKDVFLENTEFKSICAKYKEDSQKENIYDKDGRYNKKQSSEITSLHYPFVEIWSKLKDYKEVFHIPYGIEEISNLAFESSDFKEISIPTSVKIIRTHAFVWCKLEQIFIPRSVEKIEKSAFGGCPKVEKIFIERGSSTAELFNNGNNLIKLKDKLYYQDGEKVF